MHQTHETAAVRRDAGIAAAESHADADAPGWTEQAIAALKFYAHNEQFEFLAEDFSSWAVTNHIIAAPADGRAWGAVLRLAAKRGLVRRVGYAPARSSNMSPKCLWSEQEGVAPGP